MQFNNTMLIILSSLAFIFMSLKAYSENYELKPQVDGSSMALNIPVSVTGSDTELSAEMKSVWETEITHPGTDYLRVHFSDIRVVADSYEIHITNRQGEKVQVIKSKELNNTTDIWSDLIDGTLAFIEVIASASATIQFKIDRLVYQSTGSTPLSITVPDDRQHVADYENNILINKVQRSVAKLSFIKENTPYVCTGFLLANDWFLTNHHCVSEQEVCKNTVAIFGYQYTSQGELLEGKQISCNLIISSDYNLDYALLKLKNTPGETWGTLKWADRALQDQEAIYIIEHPAGQPKQISLKECRVGKAIVDGRHATSDFSHYCDTLGGSSGSPVFNKDGLVVGLHHYGFGSGLYWDTNRAVRSALIKSAIAGTN